MSIIHFVFLPRNLIRFPHIKIFLMILSKKIKDLVMKKILVLNSGSSTLKYQLFNVDGDEYEVVAKGNAERIGRDASFVGIKYANGDKRKSRLICLIIKRR